MNIIFFEVAPWEEPLYRNAFPQAVLTADKLTVDNATSYQDAEVVSTFIYSDCSEGVLKQLSKLKAIATRSTGYDHIALPYCKSKGIIVSNVPEYGSNTVAEHTFALLLTLTRKVFSSIMHVRNPDFSHTSLTGMDLYGKTLGVVGLGKIGQRVVKIARGFGMNVLVYNRTQKTDLAQEMGFRYVSFDEVLKESDVVSLHLALNDDTKHIINTANIKKMKQGVYLINTARGGLIETEALVVGLREKILAGVGLDVLEEEKNLSDEIEILTPDFVRHTDLKNLIYDHMLVRHPNVVITPHNAFNSREALMRIATTTIDNVTCVTTGSCKNTVL
jgi:D-lactate dehydrogenase